MTQTLDPATDAETDTGAPSDPQARVDAWLARFQQALAAADGAATADLFATECYWRDLIAFTWNLKTVEGREQVADLVTQTGERTAATGFATSEPPEEADGVLTAWLRFETAVGRGMGLVRLVTEDGEDRAWTLLTAMYELKGHEEPRGTHRPMGAEHGANKQRKTWQERRQEEAENLGSTTQPYVLVVGGGQGGIALGSRLRQLGVPALVVDKHPRPGDQWRGRYKSLCLHDPVWYDHLPYLKFPDNWPVFAPKDKIGDWLESYVNVMEVPYWSSTEVKSASFSEEAGEWTVELEREGRPLTLKPTQLVFATGMSGKPRVPEIPGVEKFKGDVHHSSAHPGPDAYAGKKAVVIGSNNSAFDICGALWEHDADVTMVQRSSTHIVKSGSLMEYGLGDLYSERALAAGVTTEKADLIFASLPYRIMHTFQIPAYEKMAEADKDFYDRLEKAGFWLDWGDDGSGLFMKYLRRGSGYYIDVGAADLVADGQVKLAHGQVTEFTENGVRFDDGTELPADVVVFATGYNSMNGWVADLIDQETADRLGKCWGLGSDTTLDPGPWEGEQRNMWKPTQVPNLWMHGGNLHQSRHYSLYLALQLKARLEGIDTPVYGLQEVHHTG
ncbi:putative flavoprotein involved in K+ transport [Propionibacteriaceae bacterium ES.041]|uniref:4-hydroxybenzoate brominase (decarboxylating) n=1 Tax=Enemella evansiae TaxID=2016499 RepID=A0A255GPV7_9ACTN|nr:NAD(P)/FAD-dependent oxidoreductase [Enemella evansiae]OYO03024.1 FAD-dependent oxidoreductase [Enemella evansiae]OYO17432.1 FAD-dependent oxidoreductase [Enemella evansiae]PFG69221.1 putative flavoprotein involved in K+ transport [Propionibacteriaceae bacterium ES.041]